MSIYTELLSHALDQSDRDDDEPTTGEVLAIVLERRSRLSADISSETESGWAPAAVADQLAYDIALIGLARRFGIGVDLSGFAQRQNERAQLERALETQGIHLNQLTEPNQRDESHPTRAER
jgi:hypothetical protein